MVKAGKSARKITKEGVVKTKAKSYRQQRKGTHDDAQDTDEHASATVTVPYSMPEKKKHNKKNVEIPKDMSKKSKQIQGSKRKRKEEQDAATDPQIGHEEGDAPGAGPQKKPMLTPTHMAKAAAAEGKKAAVKRSRGSKRRAQTDAVRPQTRRASASSGGVSEGTAWLGGTVVFDCDKMKQPHLCAGEYCGEFALH